MSCLSSSEIDGLIAEDLPHGDLTTHMLGLASRSGRVRFAARAAMTVCGTEEAKQIFERLGALATIRAPTSTQAAAGVALIEAQGSAAALLAGWKVAQTLIEWSSGIASAVSEMVAVARAVAPRTVIACTRKTVPFSRRVAVKAVRAGGGTMHRLGLSDTVLLFPEHRTFIAQGTSLESLAAQLRAAAPERSIVVEVTSMADAVAVAAHADVLQLEKFSPDEVARVVAQVTKRADGRPIIAAAGGIDASKVGGYATAGAEVIVTSWPFHAPPRDVQVKFAAE